MRSTHFFILMGLGLASSAFSAGFPMPKTGEWRVKEVDGGASKAKDGGSLECIETQDRKRWEDDFKKAAGDNGMDCQLTKKSESGARLAYDIRCRGRRPEGGAGSVQVYSQDAEGTLVFHRHTETSYTIEQEIKLVGMKSDAAASKGMTEKEKRMIDVATRHSAESSTKMKNEYTFVGSKCTAPPVPSKKG